MPLFFIHIDVVFHTLSICKNIFSMNLSIGQILKYSYVRWQKFQPQLNVLSVLIKKKVHLKYSVNAALDHGPLAIWRPRCSIRIHAYIIELVVLFAVTNFKKRKIEIMILVSVLAVIPRKCLQNRQLPFSRHNIKRED